MKLVGSNIFILLNLQEDTQWQEEFSWFEEDSLHLSIHLYFSPWRSKGKLVTVQYSDLLLEKNVLVLI